MPSRVEDLSPRDFFSLLSNHVFSDDFQVFLGGKWRNIRADSFDFQFSPGNMAEYGMVSGIILTEGDYNFGVSPGNTMAKIVGQNIPCEVISCKTNRDYAHLSTMDGIETRDILTNVSFEIDLVFRYQSRPFNTNWMETISEVPEEIKDKAIKEDIIAHRKKTVFDILDFD
jgi:hypothetical protein